MYFKEFVMENYAAQIETLVDNILIRTKNIVEFCAKECEEQNSGEMSVFHMYNAIMKAPSRENFFKDPIYYILQIWHDVMGHNAEEVIKFSFRQVPITINNKIAGIDWQNIPRAMENLAKAIQNEEYPDEIYKEFELIHPFTDGNGRTGAIIYNIMRGTLSLPEKAPRYFG